MPTATTIEKALRARLQQLEITREGMVQQKRNQANNIALYLIGYVLLYLCLGGVLYLVYAIALGGMFALIGFVLFGTLLLFVVNKFHNKFNRLYEDFEMQVKQEVYQEVFKTWPTISIHQYVPYKMFPESTYNQSKLYTDKSNHYRGEDYCNGKVEDGRSFQFSELMVGSVRPPKGAPLDREAYWNVFRGLFFVLEGRNVLHPLHGITFIRAKNLTLDSIQETTTYTAPFYNSDILDANFVPPIPKEAKTTASEPLFDKLYAIESNQEKTVRQTLPLEFYEQLNIIYKSFGQQLTISIERNRVYFAAPSAIDFWTVDATIPLTDSDAVRKIASHFELTFELLERIAAITAPVPKSP